MMSYFIFYFDLSIRKGSLYGDASSINEWMSPASKDPTQGKCQVPLDNAATKAVEQERHLQKTEDSSASCEEMAEGNKIMQQPVDFPPLSNLKVKTRKHKNKGGTKPVSPPCTRSAAGLKPPLQLND
ncbi:hypothetical protein HPP92_017235 [Vanilla planifolia]|uniref:Uncharacterized protein n=1 Tax=Vanilla planifolia TaxID=51239 RepID=A0A835QHB1_VANPL|nr:hypothetical protein HPP92_017235 [Vanilla planifolia]